MIYCTLQSIQPRIQNGNYSCHGYRPLRPQGNSNTWPQGNLLSMIENNTHHGSVKAEYGIAIYNYTSVSGALVKVNLLSSSVRAILASSRANLIPIQICGPKPNGMWQS